MRPGGREHDRMRRVDERELRVATSGNLGSLVLGERVHGRACADGGLDGRLSKPTWTISQSPSCRSFQSL